MESENELERIVQIFSSAPSEVRFLTLIDETGELEKVDMKMRQKKVKRARSRKEGKGHRKLSD